MKAALGVLDASRSGSRGFGARVIELPAAGLRAWFMGDFEASRLGISRLRRELFELRSAVSSFAEPFSSFGGEVLEAARGPFDAA